MIVTSTRASAGSSPSTIVPSASVKRPRVFVNMCVPMNSTVVCAGSNVYVPAGGTSIPFTTRSVVTDMADLLGPPVAPPGAVAALHRSTEQSYSVFQSSFGILTTPPALPTVWP